MMVGSHHALVEAPREHHVLPIRIVNY